MKLQKILSRFLKLHPKEIDLSLDRIKLLCKKLGNPQEKIKAISIVGTNGKQSTINAIFSILKEPNFFGVKGSYSSAGFLNLASSIDKRFMFF